MRAEIDEAFEHGLSLGDVEREIVDHARVPEDVRSALWLYAWGAHERRKRSTSAGPPLATATWGPHGGGD